MRNILVLSLIAAGSLCAADLETITQQLSRQREMTAQLQRRLDALEAKQADARKQALEAKIANAGNTSAAFSQNGFLPDIALILNMSAVARDVNNSAWADQSVPGFYAPGDAELPFNANRGLNLNYAEVAMHSAVDPYFDAFAIFHLHPDGFEIEEAYVTTRALPWNLRVKAGKFRSDFGRINAKHQHAWAFDTQPLVYKAMFGPDGIGDPGIQLQWIVPTQSYLMAGIEAMQGTNDRSFGYGESNALYIGYLKSSFDLGDTAVLAGISGAVGTNVTDHTTTVYGADLTTRTFLGAYSALTWQSEILQRRYGDGDDTATQSGLYTQLLYQINRSYTAGVRYDTIFENSDGNPADLDRYTVMAEYKPFPMSRLWLQYDYDRSKMIGGERKNVNEVIFSLNIAAGAHGAHAF